MAIGRGGFVTGIVFSPAQGLVFVRTDVGGFYRWTEASGQWTALTDSFPSAQGNLLGGESIAPDPSNPNVVYAAGGMYESSGSGVIPRSADQGATWTVNAIGVPMGGNETGRGMGERLAVDRKNGSILFFGSRSRGLYRSTSSGSSWAQVTSFPVTGDATYGLPVVVFDPTVASAAGTASVCVGAASRSGAGSNLYHSGDGGGTWTLVAGGPSGLMAHHASLGTDATLWLASSNDYGPLDVTGVTLVGQVWKYRAGTWTNVTPGGFSAANTFTGNGVPRPVFGQAGEVWVAAATLYRFTAMGATRAVVGGISGAVGVGLGRAAPDQAHPAPFVIGTVAGQYGFYRSDDGVGSKWTRFNDDQHQYGWLQSLIAGDEAIYGRAYLTTGGRGYAYYTP